MIQIRAGATRTVILTKYLAIKLPRFYRKGRRFEWSRFLYGLLANLQERYWSRFNCRQLCPVLFSDPLGLIVIMPRCQPVEKQFGNSAIVCAVEFHWFERWGTDGARVPIENVAANFGYLDGRLVSFDYGT
jgi:hypothetical protein